MKTPGIVWVVIATGFSLPPLGWTEMNEARAIFASGEGPTVVFETPDSTAALHQARQPSKLQSSVAQQTVAPQERYMGLSYWVELLGSSGEHRRVTTERLFRSGDRVQLNIMSNRDGYLYIVNFDSTGRSQLLFPHSASSAGNNLIRANTRYEVPPETHLRFDADSGEETILMMFSPSPLAGVPALPLPQTLALSKEDTERLAVIAYLKGAKDLLLEVDPASPQPASYVVAPMSMLESGGQVISLQIKLKHR